MRMWQSVAVVALLAGPLPAHAQFPGPVSLPNVSVSGEAMVGVPPDSAQLRLGATSQGQTARAASAANNTAVSAVLQALRAAGIADRDIQTSRLSLHPVYDAPRPGGTQGRISGFQASNQVVVTVRDIARLSDVIDQAVAAGANDIGGIDFVVTGASAALDKVRGEAFADARRKAEIYAGAAGVKIGRVLALSEGGGPVEPVMARAAAPMAATPIAPGERTLRVWVSVTFELVP